MKLSNRVLGLTTSPIRKLTPYANAAVKAGKKIYHLNIGQPDIPTSPKFLEAIRSFDTKVISYGPSQGYPELLKAIEILPGLGHGLYGKGYLCHQRRQ